jgi:quinohemoprotein ethanol dehydrogenase
VLDRRNGKLLRANKFDSSTNWAKEIDLKTGRPVLNAEKENARGRQREGDLSGGAGSQESPAGYDPRTKLF